MALLIVLGLVVLIAIVVLSVLFLMLSKEGQKKEEEKAVPLTDISQLKKEISPDIAPVFEPKVALPTQPVYAPLEDDAYKKRAQELENELRAITFKAESQSDEAKQMIESLTQENEALKAKQADLTEAQQKLSELNIEALGLKADNNTLQVQFEETNAKVRLLEEQMAVVKVQMGEEIHRANAMVSELTKEKEALLAAPKLPSDEFLRQELESLKYELVKARAQSSGLERINLNYKNQMEDLLKKMDAAQSANEHLSQAKNKLEGMLIELKSRNEELANKDQLAQFELEKNRSKLASLERECEDLKSRQPKDTA